MRELARLQTYPDDVVITGKHASVHKQLGNAVPSLLAEVVGREVRRQLLGEGHVSSTPTLLPPDRGTPPESEIAPPVPRRF